MKLIVLIAAVAFSSVFAEPVNYSKFAVYRFTPNTIEEINVLKTLKKTNKYDFWTEPRGVGKAVDVMVAPEQIKDVETIISIHKLNFHVIIEDVQQKINNQKSLKKGRMGFDWKNYHTLEEIYAWIKELASSNPDKITLVKGGTSYEGRDILGLKISFKPENQNRTVWIDSLIHAREWISGATSTYILNQILTSTDPTIRDIAESHDWYFFPVINPDGYEYTHTTDRMWRKTRKPSMLSPCYGVDPNRNWGYKWNEGGSSNDPCAEDYAGPSAFSEIETKSLSEFMSGIAKDLQLFITFHSYSQLILLPYGHTTKHLDNYNVTYPIGLKAAESLSKRYGTKYIVGNIAETIYEATGANLDWLKANYHVPFTYAYELRDTGANGFLLPPEQIIPTGEETLDSIVRILQEADRL